MGFLGKGNITRLRHRHVLDLHAEVRALVHDDTGFAFLGYFDIVAGVGGFAGHGSDGMRFLGTVGSMEGVDGRVRLLLSNVPRVSLRPSGGVTIS